MTGNPILLRVARAAIALLFLVTGALKLLHPDRMAPTFQKLGLPGELALAVGAFEVAAAIAFIAAFRLRLLSPVLAAWCIFTALIGHPFWADPSQLSNFLKNVGLAGAFLLFFVPGTGSVPAESEMAR